MKKKAILIMTIVLAFSLLAIGCLAEESKQDLEIWNLYDKGEIEEATALVDTYYAEDESKIEQWYYLMDVEQTPDVEEVVDVAEDVYVDSELYQREDELYLYEAELVNGSEKTITELTFRIDAYDRFSKSIDDSEVTYTDVSIAPGESFSVETSMDYDYRIGFYEVTIVSAIGY